VGEFKMPSLGADMTSGLLVEWCVNPGDTVKRGDIIAVVGTDKGDIEVEVWEDGVVSSVLVDEGQEVPVGTVLALIGDVEKSAEPQPLSADRIRISPAARRRAESRGIDLATIRGTGPQGSIQLRDLETLERDRPERIRATPVARRIAQDEGLDLSTVCGTGPGGSIQKDDVQKMLAASKAKPKAVPTDGTCQAPGGLPLAIRKAIAQVMSRSNREIPHYYLKTKIDLSTALQWMEEQNAGRPAGERLIPATLLARAVVKGLKKTPELNAYWVDDEHQLQSEINLGIAISLRDGGVLTPAICGAQNLPLKDLRAPMNDLIARSRVQKLRASEMGTATITMTNMGERGVEEVFGVIYPPQVALVGFGRISEQPWAENGMLGVRPVVTATLAADHRASDGRVGARYLNAVAKALQKPEKL
jgi:pyruvate dehydrogenase E2 component (dihydrolipoyllysine-residue acetyltransferase)